MTRSPLPLYLVFAVVAAAPPVVSAESSMELEPIAEIELRDREIEVETVIRTRDDDPAYWADRLQQAMLPRASMRARLRLESSDKSRPIREYGGSLVRVEGPTSIRSVLTIERPSDARRVIKVESLPSGGAERTVYTNPETSPISLTIDPSERILLTSLTYEDLGFVPLAHRAGDSVEFEAASEGAVVRLVSEPYGRYGRVVTRIDRKTALPLETEYFDKRGMLIRRVTYSEVDREGPYSFPLRIEAVDLRTGFRTTVRLTEAIVGAPIYEYEFSDPELRRRLRNIR